MPTNKFITQIKDKINEEIAQLQQDLVPFVGIQAAINEKDFESLKQTFF